MRTKEELDIKTNRVSGPSIDRKYSRAAIEIRGFTLLELMLVVAIVGILTGIALSSYGMYIERTKTVKATVDMHMIALAIEGFYNNNNKYPETLSELNGLDSLLDPWGNPYQYLNITTTKGNGKVRKDHNLVPLNTDYDLYSMGKDGKTASPLTAKASRDDIVRANNGAYIGLASDY